ncbi:MAG: hypothetical protein J0I81_03730, partial [Hyphomicrobium sp.]|nr:hypothetical protein [Hyphomicrobium sp.]
MDRGKQKSGAAAGRSRGHLANILTIGFVALSVAGGLVGDASAQSFGWFNFGPTGNDGPSYSTNRADPDFVR